MKIFTLAKSLNSFLYSIIIKLCSLTLLFFPQFYAQPENSEKNLQEIWESGLPFITNYTPDDYKASVQNWCFTQDDNGIMYVGNTSGVLEFDGVSWRLIKLPNGNPGKSLAKSKDNVIYVGSVGDFGLLEADSFGQMEFQSLLPKLDTAYQNFADIWFTFVANEATYFISDDYIFKWDNEAFKVWKSEKGFGFANLINDQLYIQNVGVGLMHLYKDSLTLVPEGDKFLNEEYIITIMLPYEENKILMGGYWGGLFLYDHNKIIPFGKEGKNLLRDKHIYSGAVLPNGDYVFITGGNGCFIVDKEGSVKSWFGKKRGISSDGIIGLYVDREGSLWLATENGIDKIEISSSLRIFNQQNGLNEPVNRIIFHNNKFYAAGSNGVFYLSEVTSEREKKDFSFQKIAGIGGFTWDLISKGENLFAANFLGLYQISPDHKIKLLISENTSSLTSSLIDTNLIFAGSNYDRVYILRFLNEHWRVEKVSLSVKGRIFSMAENPDGSLWITTRYDGIYKIDWSSPFTERSFDKNYTVIHYDTSHGLPEISYNIVFQVKDDVYFSTFAGIFHFDDTNKRFIPDSLLMNQLEETTSSFENAIEASYDGGMWLVLKSNFVNTIYKVKENTLNQISELKRFSNFDVHDIYDKKNTVFFGGPKGIIAYNLQVKRSYSAPFSVNLRKVITSSDSLLFAGHTSSEAINSFKKVSLPFRNNSLRFEYSLPAYDKPDANHYQYFLEGYDEDWSAWSTEPQRDFTNLSEGEYIFHIRGKNIYGQISNEAVYAFTILPPWHRTWWAYLLYSLIVLGILGLIVQWRSKHLIHEKELLENIVKERTRQLAGQAEQLTEQADQLKEMDKQKARFFANISHEFRTPLTLIKGPIEQALQTPDESLSKEDEVMIRNNADRLLRLVNQLLDLSRLDANIMELNPVIGDIFGFLRAVGSAFNSHADQRKIDYHILVPENELYTMFDHDKLEKILYNLLSNAFKFTYDKGEIRVSAFFSERSRSESAKDDLLTIEVADTGIGISSEHLPFIFDRFYQTDDSLAREHEGAGIGLSLTKELVVLMGGDIQVTSQPNKGSIFMIQLPVNVTTTEFSQITHYRSISKVEKIPSGQKVLKVNSEGAEEVTDGLPIILIVEDNADMRNFIRKQLANNYRILEASHGKEGLEIAKREIPDLIITDLMMPKMDGIALCGKLKSDEHTSHIPVIMLTAKAGQEYKIEGLETGADDYLTKPFDRKELQVRVNNLIQQRQQLRKKFSREIILQPRNISITSLDEQFFIKVENVIEQNLSDERFGLPQMQNALAMSKTQLHRKIKALTDQAPGEYLRNYRLKRAAQILAQQGNNVTQVAYSVGFNNLSYFAKCFKELYGVAPSDYQRKIPS